MSIGFFGYFFGSIILGQHFNVIHGLKIGTVAFGVFSGIFDLIQPPLFLNSNGQVLIPLGTSSLESVAVDAFAASIFGAISPSVVGTPSLFYLTYLVTPLLVLVLAAFILTPKQFITGLISSV